MTDGFPNYHLEEDISLVSSAVFSSSVQSQQQDFLDVNNLQEARPSPPYHHSCTGGGRHVSTMVNRVRHCSCHHRLIADIPQSLILHYIASCIPPHPLLSPQ